jgi:hypothetical protein
MTNVARPPSTTIHAAKNKMRYMGRLNFKLNGLLILNYE